MSKHGEHYIVCQTHSNDAQYLSDLIFYYHDDVLKDKSDFYNKAVKAYLSYLNREYSVTGRTWRVGNSYDYKTKQEAQDVLDEHAAKSKNSKAGIYKTTFFYSCD